MSDTFKFIYRIGDKVHIIAPGVIGTITMRRDCGNGQDFYVVYWMNGERRAEWLDEWELEPAQ